MLGPQHFDGLAALGEVRRDRWDRSRGSGKSPPSDQTLVGHQHTRGVDDHGRDIDPAGAVVFASIASRIGNGDVRSVFEVMNQTADAPALPAGPNAHSRLRPTGSGSRCRSRWWPTSCARALDPRQGPWRRGRCSSRTRSSARGGPWSLPTTSGSGRPRRTRTSSVRAKRARCSIRSARHMSSRRAAGRRHGRVGSLPRRRRRVVDRPPGPHVRARADNRRCRHARARVEPPALLKNLPNVPGGALFASYVVEG